MICGAIEAREIGARDVGIRVGSTDYPEQPFVVLREATYVEYAQDCEVHHVTPNDVWPHYYEISTD